MPIRIWHWLNAFGIVTFCVTGFQIRFPDYINIFGAYKAAIRLQNRTVNAPKVVAAFSKANANFMRAYSLWQADTQQQTEKAEPPPAPPTEKSSGPPPTNKIDLFKDWQ